MTIKTCTKAFAALAIWAFAATSGAAPVTPATSADAPQSTRISLGDLALGNDASAREVLRRIRRAAVDVCSDEIDQRECVRDTVGRAAAAVDDPMVTARYYGRSKPASVLATTGH